MSINNIIVVCNKEHIFTPGVCLACERDNAAKDNELLRQYLLELTTEGADQIPVAVRFTCIDDTKPVLQWTRMPSGEWVVLAGEPDNFDSFWFDRLGHHPKSKLIFQSSENGKGDV